MANKTVIVLPLYKQFCELQEDEKISFDQCCKVFCSYDIYFVTHDGIDTVRYINNQKYTANIYTITFEKKYFDSIAGYNQLMLSIKFYKHFLSYQYILLTQLDVFIFSNKLSYFIDLDLDYIGAPWFEGYENANKNSQITGVGNGGFSLRKVQSYVKILNILESFKVSFLSRNALKVAIKFPSFYIKLCKNELFSCPIGKAVSMLPEQFHGNEDVYWSCFIKMFFPWFKIASVADAISFAFEVNPSVLFDLNNKQLPMAAHAWKKYDFAFWKPFIEEEGYNLCAITC